MTVPWPVPPEDTGIGFHADPDAYDKPSDFRAHARDVKAHGGRWWKAWLYDENKADFIRVMREEANGTKAVKLGLSRAEIISVIGMLVWVVSALTMTVVYLATNGHVAMPLP